MNPESCCDFCVELVKHVRTTKKFGKSWEMIRFALSPYPFGVNQAIVGPLSNLILIFPTIIMLDLNLSLALRLYQKVKIAPGIYNEIKK